MFGKVLNAHLQVIVNGISYRLYLSQTKMLDIWLDNENFIWQKFQEKFLLKELLLSYFWSKILAKKKKTKSFIVARQGPIFLTGYVYYVKRKFCCAKVLSKIISDKLVNHDPFKKSLEVFQKNYLFLKLKTKS